MLSVDLGRAQPDGVGLGTIVQNVFLRLNQCLDHTTRIANTEVAREMAVVGQLVGSEAVLDANKNR